MREVIQAKPDFGNARFELGNALLKKGDIKGAVESLEMAAKLEPGQAYVHYQLGRAYIAAGRAAEGESQLEISKQLKERAKSKKSIRFREVGILGLQKSFKTQLAERKEIRLNRHSIQNRKRFRVISWIVVLTTDRQTIHEITRNRFRF